MILQIKELSYIVAVHSFLILVAVFPVYSDEYLSSHRYPTPRFRKTNTNVTVHMGETADFVCSIENLGTRGVIWRHLPNQYPLTVGTFIYTPDESIKIEHQFESEDWRLIISNVQKSHAGEYECQISSRDTKYRQIFYLNVLDAVKTTNVYVREGIYIHGPSHVNTGDSFKVYCNATGVDYPPEEIDWFINGFKIKTDFDRGIIMDKSVSLKTKSIESTIHIVRAKMENSGDYTCRVSTGLVKTTDVKVLYTDKNNSKKRVPDDKINNKSRAVDSNLAQISNRSTRHIVDMYLLIMYIGVIVYCWNSTTVCSDIMKSTFHRRKCMPTVHR